MVVGATMTANAEEFQGSKDWNVSFVGEKMESNFTSAEMTEEILQIQPGDSITLQVKIKNDSADNTDWYMTNEVLQTLEESQKVAEGGAYTYILTYKNVKGEETVLYNSEVVGGEEDTSKEGQGLHQATNSLEDYFYLDRLNQGEGGTVQLVVKLDGETQGNDYQDTLARLQMNFAVEKLNDGKVTVTIPTGDAAQLVLFSAVALVSGLVLLVVAFYVIRQRRHREGE